ncbi:cytochrome c biogenesis heme-transporting ATPase CcmA [Ectothiorhodospira variabilis]|uniref:cytochrome c biogenesis heme-transporting ATPase CcmA n=1 Tax=Ectothiorhodospira variabilis TaxID=505694 RepID=UPI001EFA545F|nr:cytochrome c biogenesis heme-transporting ATPase CcmA [Ectothiorhodospira variabilis]MCG5493672.1 cytochrome c biogenesis heme-transporting ATPase CcmA [Ectothiorhodospira variabilis]MCG5503001.1 cytochrome c biogenesis heme-transporting ATPase CcmA [Ectothiorhodospira variabilis]MCG5506211.1 cytochrome c biogenesis heme-transporting ATPase CcmA [Ectothiorhodospira variabilis]
MSDAAAVPGGALDAPIPQPFPAHCLAVDGLALERGERLLFNGLTFSLEAGELLQVAGRNGAGKTSLLRVLCGLTRPMEGEMTWNGVPVRRLDDGPGGHLAYLGHHNALKDELSAEENIQSQCRLHGCPQAPEVVFSMLEELGLGGHADLPVKLLSQGQKRRVALARLLLLRRPLWILDEPFAALDVQVIEVLRQALEAHLAARGMIILTTHQAVPVRGTQRTLTLGTGA